MQSPDNCKWQSNKIWTTTTSTMKTIPEDSALGSKLSDMTSLENNLTTKASNLTTSGAGRTRPSLSTSFFDQAAHGCVNGGSSNNNNNSTVNTNVSNNEDSEYSLPHLMRTASLDDDDDVSGSFVG